MKQILNGQWSGIINYGPEYGDLQNEELFFVADLNEEDNLITGTATDLNEKEDTGIASIKGFIDGNKISFIKQYPYDSYYDEFGKIIIDKTKVGPEINYFGVWNFESNSIEGSWEIIVETKKIGDQLFENICTGSFKMSKKITNQK